MILSTRHGNVEARDATLGALMKASGVEMRSGSSHVSERDVRGIPAWTQAVRIASESIAKHEMAVWRGKGIDRRQVTSTWQARLFAGMPNQEGCSWFSVWEATEASLTGRHNAVWRLFLNGAGQAEQVEFVHPDCVRAKIDRKTGETSWQIRMMSGWVDIDPREILHFKVGHVDPGAVWAPSPVEMHRKSLATFLARTDGEARMWDRGSMKSIAVVFPGDVTPEQGQAWKDVYLGPGGVQTDDQVKVFGGDPRIESIGLSMHDAQYVEALGLGTYDIGRMLGVMPSLLWAAMKDGDKPLTPEHEEDRWCRHGLSGRRMRIEETIRACPTLFGAGSRDYPKFLAPVVTGDRMTEAERALKLVQGGIIVPDTAAVELGYPELPEGLGKIPQVVPVGGAPNPGGIGMPGVAAPA